MDLLSNAPSTANEFIYVIVSSAFGATIFCNNTSVKNVYEILLMVIKKMKICCSSQKTLILSALGGFEWLTLMIVAKVK